MRPLAPLAIALLCAVTALPAAAGGPKVKVQNKGDQYKYEYKDHRCQFKYQVKFSSGEVKSQEKGDCSHIGHFPQFAPPAAAGHRHKRQPSGTIFTCNSQSLGTLLGTAAGAAAGSRLGDGDALAIAAGSVLGALLGSEIGQRIDSRDRRCIGSALAYAGSNQVFDFVNRETGLDYALRPLQWSSRGGSRCRSFDARFGSGRWRRGLACHQGGGWQIVDLD